jgi:Na+/H+ antiporter NhaD/arsenite permease-like protein
MAEVLETKCQELNVAQFTTPTCRPVRRAGSHHGNVLVGLTSAILDNIPLMFALLTMQPEMSHGQWLLITLTAGVGGSLLSIGSAAGIAIMGQAHGTYTVAAHLRLPPVIALGYAASIVTHMVLNRNAF